MSWFFRDEAEMFELTAQRLCFPDHYLVSDIETSGFSRAQDLILEVGWGVVRDRKLVDRQGLILDWTRFPGIDHRYLASQLLRLETDYAAQGRPFYFPWERLARDGLPPLEVLHCYATLVFEHIQRGDPIVGHNFWRFDRDFINASTTRFLQGYTLPWQLNSIWDTGLMEKAAQLNQPPWPGDTLDGWYHRIEQSKKRIKWNLDKHCATKYRLVERFGLDMRLAHTAGFDCHLTHCLFETYRELTGILRVGSEPTVPHAE